MKNKDILVKAIAKAVKNGYCKDQPWCHIGDEIDEGIILGRCQLMNWSGYEPSVIIFEHDFAEAFFGSELLCYDCGESVKPPMTVMGGAVQIGTGQCNCGRQFENNMPAWEYHLREMVATKDQIKYLEQYLDKDA